LAPTWEKDVILRNTEYLVRAHAALPPEQHLIPHVTPLSWEHIGLAGEITSGATTQRQLRETVTAAA
jgi:hypothetical protein